MRFGYDCLIICSCPWVFTVFYVVLGCNLPPLPPPSFLTYYFKAHIEDSRFKIATRVSTCSRIQVSLVTPQDSRIPIQSMDIPTFQSWSLRLQNRFRSHVRRSKEFGEYIAGCWRQEQVWEGPRISDRSGSGKGVDCGVEGGWGRDELS